MSATGEGTVSPGAGQEFRHWWGDATLDQLWDSEIEVTMNADKVYEATFANTGQYYSLLLTCLLNGSTDPAQGMHLVPVGGDFTAETIPDAGYAFDHWSYQQSTDNPITIPVNSNAWLAASTAVARTLTMSATGEGTVSPSAGAHVYPDGRAVVIEAVAADDWAFVEWTGAVTGSTNPTSVTMDADKAVTGVFLPLYDLTTAVEGSGTVTLSPDGGTYVSGTAVTVTATPAGGWLFDHWTGAATGAVNPVTVTMDADKTVTASAIAWL